MSAINSNQTLRAAITMIGAMSIIGVIDNYIAVLAQHVGLWQFHATRAAMALPLVVGLSLLGLGTLRPVRVWAVAVRSLLLATSMLFYFSALALMPIAQALAGLFTSPIFILLISAFGMGQRIGPWRIGAVALGFLGILLALQPDPQNFDLKILIPVCAGFFYALSALATRAICAEESTMSMLLGMWLALGAMGVIGSLVLVAAPLGGAQDASGFVTRAWEWPMWQAVPWIALQAVGSVIGVFFIIRAYQLADATYVSVFEYSVMVVGPLYAWIAFAQPVGVWQIAGITCIAGAGMLIAVRSR